MGLRFLAVDVLTQFVEVKAGFEQKPDIAQASDQKCVRFRIEDKQGYIQDIEGVAVEMCLRKK